MSGEPWALGVDLGGTKTVVGAVSARGQILSRERFWTEPTRGSELVVHSIVRAATALMSQLGEPQAIGIASGGPLDPSSATLIAPIHLPGWRDVPIGAQLEAELKAPARLVNDGTAAALGEHHARGGDASDTLLYLTVSTGIGSGLVINGRPYLGNSGNGTEFGHTTVVFGGRECLCGRAGCLEAYSSGTAIGAIATEALGEGPASHAVLSAKDVHEMAVAGDQRARRVWDDAIEKLTNACVDAANCYEPRWIVIGGGVAMAMADLHPRVAEQVASQAFMGKGATPAIEEPRLGAASPLVGAALLAIEVSG
ncbi:glucokinase [Microbacterium sp. SLBN-154]|uniref:ROK family protein n=1 Tax=Microbacterium sp. SLBN-154 TaxID=2768458 RepID=UPI001153EAE3|nr:ROK family protein [Microbacterium sp. SLBN-154]TQK17703.1 glucokinase [Microbacterium sp. SLBN-154]